MGPQRGEQGRLRTAASRGPVAGFGSGPADSGRIQGLDGLRAIAVGLVVLFHLLPDHLPGGFLGVDVFFVISGFLITTLLLREVRRNGYMNMPTFWMRRIRRLVPALVVLLLVCTAAVLVVDLTRGGDLRVGLARQILGGLTFTTNWVEIVHGTSYFDQNQPVLYKPLWSLSVEEQFYLFWPPVLALLLAVFTRWRGRMLTVAGLAVGSALWMAVLYFVADDVTRPYYGTDSHLFGLMAGVLVAFVWMSRTSWLRGEQWLRLRGPIGVAALVGVVALSFVMPEDRAVTYVGGLFLASLLTAVVIASLLPGRTALHTLLELRPLEWVGERSYGLYLWHWPVLLLFSAALPPQSEGSAGSWLLRLVALAVAVAMTEASYRWVETPIRRQGIRAWVLGAVDAVRGRGDGRSEAADDLSDGAAAGGPDRRRAALPARVAAGGAGLALLMSGMAVATAPERTETQQAIEENEKALEEMASDPAPTDQQSSSPGAGAPSSGADASPDPGDDGSVPASPDESSSAEPTDDSGKSAEGWYVPAGDQLSVFGDSLVVTSLYGFKDQFPGVAIDAKSNRQWTEGKGIIKAHLDDGDVRDSVVISFGTNAGVRDPQVVREALDLLGPDRQVVLVNLYGKSSWIEESNDNLEAVAEDYSNVVVADWHSLAKERPELLQSDGVHPGVEGGNAYASLVKEAFAAQAE
ncbi:acyltransferase family protein [Kytococcus sp. Marseille-QA3725]